jgi:hypothetical protein
MCPSSLVGYYSDYETGNGTNNWMWNKNIAVGFEDAMERQRWRLYAFFVEMKTILGLMWAILLMAMLTREY